MTNRSTRHQVPGEARVLGLDCDSNKNDWDPKPRSFHKQIPVQTSVHLKAGSRDSGLAAGTRDAVMERVGQTRTRQQAGNQNVEKWPRRGENYSFNSIKSNPSTWQSSYEVIPR